MDFDMLPAEKQAVYKAIHTHHIHASPDGPWFFIIARNDVDSARFQLIGITDTAMLRPQVFALQEGEVQVGLICSEKQAIDATLISLARKTRVSALLLINTGMPAEAAIYDGGAFIFNLRIAATAPIICA
jgi:hypothetical protein